MGHIINIAHKHYFSHLSFDHPIRSTPGSYFIEEKFELKKLDLIPTKLGRMFLFNFVKLLLSFMFGQIIQAVKIELVVKKELS